MLHYLQGKSRDSPCPSLPELLGPTAFLHPDPSPVGGVTTPAQPLGWKQPALSSPPQNRWQQLPSGTGAHGAAGSGEVTGPACGCAAAGPGITASCERTGGLGTASSSPPWSLYQMVKSTGTGFSFPPKLDKLESNELVRGKIKSSALLSKRNNPFADFLSENITDIIRCGT